jgi:nicotinamide phosphoribosyltransferase
MSGPNIFPPFATDFYKTGHIRQYPPGTEKVYSNFTPRSSKLANVLQDFDNKVVFFGLQGVIQWMLMDMWNREFFHKPRAQVLARIERMMTTALGPGAVALEPWGALHDLGYLPIEIKALPEGSRVNVRVPLWTITNTLPEFYWITNYLETQLSSESWKMVTSATTAYEYRRLLDAYADETGSAKAFVPWQGHDFSYRGLSGISDATQSGAAHLLSFTGTDTISAIDYLDQYYGSGPNEFIGGSVPATEHSVMCMGGKESEIETFRRLFKTYPAGVLSIVSDTWDFWQVITNYAKVLKPEIMARQAVNDFIPGKTVFRPDSGDPVNIIVGDEEAPVGSPQNKGAVECLWDVFGGTKTTKGYKMLDSHVGLIYGDSINLDRAQRILAGLKRKGFASGNIVFGIGSYTYQYVTRDSYGTAIKATFGIVDKMPRELFKDPKTDNGIKKSAVGLLRVEKEGNDYVLYDHQSFMNEKEGLLETVFKDGKLVRKQNLSDIRQRLMTENRSIPTKIGLVA